MIKHFGLELKKTKNGYYMTRENYARINNRNSFGYIKNINHKPKKKDAENFYKIYKDNQARFYSDEWCSSQQSDALENYDLNIDFYSNLDTFEFNNAVNTFLKDNPSFLPVLDLNNFRKKSGYYLMVLDKYKQVYIGTSSDLFQRIYKHWTKQTPFDRLIFGSIQSSRLSINSFRPLDTTRLYIKVDDETFIHEDSYVVNIPEKFLCNRTVGGFLEEGLLDAVKNMKNRNF